MNIVDRINKISGVEETHWDSAQNRLVVYYSDSIPVDTMKKPSTMKDKEPKAILVTILCSIA